MGLPGVGTRHKCAHACVGSQHKPLIARQTAAGRGWIGITPREAYLTTDVTVTPLVRAWLFLMLAALLTIGAWLIEGRRTRQKA
jgi:hypothetical protein